MNANELADKQAFEQGELSMWIRNETATMLRQQQAEIEALKMGFANSGTSDSNLAETRAMANRFILKIQELEFEREGYENLTEMLESEKAELVEKSRQQQAENEAVKESNKNLMELVTMLREEVNSLRQLQAENEALKERLDQATQLGSAYAIRMGVAEGHTNTAIHDAILDLKGN